MRFLIVSSLFASAGAAYLKPAPAFAQDRVVGGAPASAGQFPFYAYVQVTKDAGAVACGGSVISPTYVSPPRTASTRRRPAAASTWRSHPPHPPDRYGVLGMISHIVILCSDPSNPSSHQAISFTKSDVTIHPLYRAGTPSYDLALVRLSVASKYPSIPIAGAGLLHGASSVVAGYGYTGVLSPTGAPSTSGFPTTLQFANIPVVDPTLCSQLWGPLYNASQHTCAGSWTGAVDSCVGDSGGPLAIVDPNGKAIALGSVVAFGSGCAQYGSYGVYTRVFSFIGWIKSVVLDLPAIKQITAAIEPSAGETVCSHAIMTSTTPTVVLDCGLNTIATVKLSAYTNQVWRRQRLNEDVPGALRDAQQREARVVVRDAVEKAAHLRVEPVVVGWLHASGISGLDVRY